MGNKEAKFKKLYEEIDISGDGQVCFNELAIFIISDKARKELQGASYQYKPWTFQIGKLRIIFVQLQFQSNMQRIF